MAALQTDTHAREQTKRDEKAQKNDDAPEPGFGRLAAFRQRATEDAWKSMESSVDAASQGVQNASDQFARTLGFSGEEGERLARQSGQNMEAITKFGTVLTQACQDTSREWYGLAQKQLQRNLEGLSKLAHCRSVQDFAAVQSSLIRESLQFMVEDTRSIVGISVRAVDELARPSRGQLKRGLPRGAQAHSLPEISKAWAPLDARAPSSIRCPA